jgi:hypothetical protein
MIHAIVKGKVAKLNICMPPKEPVEVKGEDASVYEWLDDEYRVVT